MSLLFCFILALANTVESCSCDSKPYIHRNTDLTQESQACWLECYLCRFEVWGLGDLLQAKRDVRPCSDSHSMSFCAADVHNGLASFLIVSAYFSAVELWHSTRRSPSANSFLDAAVKVLQLSSSVAKLPMVFTLWLYSHLVSSGGSPRENHEVKKSLTGPLWIRNPRMWDWGKSETLSPSALT